jgi:NitT/TauT family transport system substrate-binding protein
VRRLTAFAALAAVSAVAVAGCGSSDQEATETGTAAATKSITVGFDNPLAYTNNIAVLIAQKQGFFKDEGITVKTVAFNGGSDATKALVGGSIQVQAGVGFDAIGAQAKSIDAKAFFGVAQDSDFAFFANPDTGATSFKALAGKKVAISTFGSYTDFLTKQIVSTQGLASDAITEVPLGPNPTIVASVAKGETAGTWAPSPYGGLYKGKAQSIGTASELGFPSQYSSLIAMGDYIDSQADTLKRFNDAIQKAIEWHRTHRDQAIALAVAQMKMPQEIAETSYDAAAPILTASGEINQAGMEAMAKAVPELKLGPSAPAVTDTYTDALLPAGSS